MGAPSLVSDIHFHVGNVPQINLTDPYLYSLDDETRVAIPTNFFGTESKEGPFAGYYSYLIRFNRPILISEGVHRYQLRADGALNNWYDIKERIPESGAEAAVVMLYTNTANENPPRIYTRMSISRKK